MFLASLSFPTAVPSLMKKWVSQCWLGSGERHEVENSRQVCSASESQGFSLFHTMPPAPLGKPGGMLQGHYSMQAAGRSQGWWCFPERPEQIKCPAEKNVAWAHFSKWKLKLYFWRIQTRITGRRFSLNGKKVIKRHSSFFVLLQLLHLWKNEYKNTI